MDLIGKMGIYVLLTGVLGKNKSYIICLIFQFQKMLKTNTGTLLKKYNHNIKKLNEDSRFLSR